MAAAEVELIEDVAHWIRLLLDPGTRLGPHRFFSGRVGRAWTSAKGDDPRNRLRHHLISAAHDVLEVAEPGGILRCQPGEVLWLPPATRAVVSIEGRKASSSMQLVWFEVKRDGRVPTPFLQPVCGRTTMPLDAAGWRLAGEAGASDVLALLAGLFASDLRRAPAPPIGDGLSTQQRAQIERLARSPDAALGPADLARALKLSPAWFSRRFTATYGVPPRIWLVHRRLERAAEMLRATSEPVAAIAAACGWEQPEHFCTQFHRRYGVSPRAFRRST